MSGNMMLLVPLIMKEYNDFQTEILDIVDEYKKIRNSPEEIMRLHDLKENLNEISLYLSSEFLKQSVTYSDNKAEYEYLLSESETKYMKMQKYNDKKMTSAYAKTLSQRDNKEIRRTYVKAEGIRDGLKQYIYTITGYVNDITQRIASLKKSY